MREREYCLRTGNERINLFLLFLWVGLKLFMLALGSGYSLCKPESPWEDITRKSWKPKCMFLPADSSTREILQAGRRSQLGRSLAMWLCWEERRLETELSWRGQRCLGEAGEQRWLCYFLWLWAENYRGSPGRRGRVILMEAQFSSAGRRHGWM